MNETLKALTTHRPAMSLRELVARWSSENGAPFEELVNRLWEAALGGEFDHIVPANGGTGGGLIHIDKDTGRFWAPGSEKFRVAIARVEEEGHDAATIRAMFINEHGIGLRREAVWHFCRSRKIRPPSFWPFPKKTKGGHGTRVAPSPATLAKIHAFLNDIPAKSMTTDELVKAVIDKFNINRAAAREAVRAIRAERKLKRGEKLSTLPQ